MSKKLDQNSKELIIEDNFASQMGKFFGSPDLKAIPLPLMDFPSKKMRELDSLFSLPKLLFGADSQGWARRSLNESQLMSNLPGMVYRCLNEPNRTMKFVSEGCCRLTGYEAAVLIDNQHSYSSIIEPSDRKLCWEQVQTALKKKQSFTIEYRIRTRTGEQKWVWEKGCGIDTPSGRLFLEGFITDISDRKRAEASLRQAEARYTSFFNNAFEGIFQSTADGKLMSANPALAKIYGYDSPTEMIESFTTIDLIYVDSQRRADWVRLLLETGAVLEYESQVYRQDGSVIWISENARAVRDEQERLLYFEGTVQDITARKQAKEQLHRQAFYDPLTGLANRALFMERLQAVLESTRQKPACSEQFAVLFLDLDRFKVVNDSFGHAVGDQLLVAIARRLESCLREQDTVARLGGDEFTILLEELQESQQAIRVAERIKQKLDVPFRLSGHQVFVGVSIGIWLSDVGLDVGKPEDLLRNADTALYQAKALGKGCYQIFDQTMHQSAVTQIALETDLRQALKRREFELYYQPIVSLANGQLTGFEALLRWQHPTKGLMNPAQFISLAEETGLILPIGLWGLQEACRQLFRWHDQSGLTIGVNLSVKQFSQPKLVEQIDQILQETGLNGSRLRIEITESCYLHNEALAIATLQALRERQIGLCLDNFGSYSCLNYLHSFPLNAIKIDQTLVQQINTDTKQAKIARALLALAKDLELEAIAKGIETAAQLEQLRLNCQFGQGYLFSKPLDAKAATALVSSHLVRASLRSL